MATQEPTASSGPTGRRRARSEQTAPPGPDIAAAGSTEPSEEWEPSDPPAIADDGSDIEADHVELRMAAVGSVNATELDARQSAIGAARADTVAVDSGAVGALMAGEARFDRSFANSVLARTVHLERSGSRSIVAAEAHVSSSAVGVIVACRVTGDVRPLLDWRAGLALGVAFAIVARLLGAGRRA